MNNEKKMAPKFSLICVPFAHILHTNRNLGSLNKILGNVPDIL